MFHRWDRVVLLSVVFTKQVIKEEKLQAVLLKIYGSVGNVVTVSLKKSETNLLLYVEKVPLGINIPEFIRSKWHAR